MTRIQYNPSARRKGFRAPQLSKAGINRMREESNRIIQNMQDRRQAQREQDERDYQAMKENAAYEEARMAENQEIALANFKNERMQELSNRQVARENKANNTQLALEALSDFSKTAVKTLVEQDLARRKEQEARDRQYALANYSYVKSYEEQQRILANDTRDQGGIELATQNNIDGARRNEDVVDTKRSQVGNPALNGAARDAVLNRDIVINFDILLGKRLSNQEKVFIAEDGRKYSGTDASQNRYFMSQLIRETTADSLEVLGISDPFQVKDGLKEIETRGKVYFGQARSAEEKQANGMLMQRAYDRAAGGKTIDFEMAFQDLRLAFASPKLAHDELQKLVSGSLMYDLEEVRKADLKGNGNTYDKEFPARWAKIQRDRNALFVKQQNQNEQVKIAKDKQWVNNNADDIRQAFEEDPYAAAFFVKERYNQLQLPVPDVIRRMESHYIGKHKELIDHQINVKATNGNLDLSFVNNIRDEKGRKKAMKLYKEQEERKYGPDDQNIKKGLKSLARKLTSTDVTAQGDSPRTNLLHAAIHKTYVDKLKQSGDPKTAFKETEEQIKNDRDVPGELFYFDPVGGIGNSPSFPNIMTSPRETVEKNIHIDKKTLQHGVDIVDLPFHLADQKQMDLAYSSSIVGVVEYPPGIIRIAERFNLKPSEVFNAQRKANNAVTGANKPLLKPTPFSSAIDNASPEQRKLFLSGVPAMINRGAAMTTGQLPRRASMVQNTGVRGLANLVSSGEGNPTSMFPGENYPEMTDMTIREVVELQKQKLGDGRASAAVGSYQFLYPEKAAQFAGLSLDEKFTPENQLKMFVGTLLNKPGRENVSAFLQGLGNNIEAAIDELAQEFASIEYQNGRSYYDDGVNKASIPRDQVRAALLSARQELTTQ